MTTAEMLAQSKHFTDELVKQLSDTNAELSKKQVYFMDNHAKVQACMNALKEIVSSVKASEATASSEDLEAMNNASAILTDLQGAITKFQQELMIVDTVQEDDLAPVHGLTADNIADAAKNNETTKKIVQDMNVIINQPPAYSHCLVCDGVINMFLANTKDELNEAINRIAATGNYKDLRLFQMSFTPVPMKKQTILTV